MFTPFVCLRLNTGISAEWLGWLGGLALDWGEGTNYWKPWADCVRIVTRIHADCVFELQAPEIQTMYSLNISVGELRTKMREQFERHRYVKQLPVVDMLLFQSHAEYQVWIPFPFCYSGWERDIGSSLMGWED